jgi:hypothetical protein
MCGQERSLPLLGDEELAEVLLMHQLLDLGFDQPFLDVDQVEPGQGLVLIPDRRREIGQAG